MKQKFTQFSLLAIGLLMGYFSVVAQSPTYSAVQVSDVGASNSIGTSNSTKNIGVDRNGNIYVIFWGSLGVRVAKSTNRGQSFLASVPVDNNITTGEADIEIADNGNIYVTWIRSSVAYFSKSTDGGTTFSTPTTLGSVSLSSLPGIRIESYGDNIYILPRTAIVMYRNTTQGDGSFTAVNTGIANRTFSDIFADQYSGDLYIVGDNPNISIHKSTDNGSTFGSISLNPSISRYYSSYTASITYAGKYAFAGGGPTAGDVKIGYKINLTDGTSTAITLGDNKVPSGRSLLVDDFGNLVDGYSITSSSVGFRISNNQGSTWGSQIEVATNATGQNLFRNKKDLLAAYVSGGQVYLSTYTDILPIPCEPTISPSTAQTVASGASISFSGSSIASSPSYTWSSIPNGFSSSDRNPTFIAPTVASSTDYILRLNTTEGNCSADAIVKVTVVPPCTPPTANISYTGSPFCSNALPVSVALTGTNTYTGGFYSSTAGLSIDAVTGEITPSTSSAGIYTVTYTIAAAGGCDPVTATTSVSINPLPTAYSVTGGGSYCAGGTGVAVGLSNSETGVNYQLKKDGSNVGSAVAGTGSALPFGNQTGAGTYTVEATTATGSCVATMTGSVTVTMISLPTAYNVTGGGSYCAGGTGVAVGLSNSETGVNYQLKKDGSNVGSAVAGTGSALPFGNQTGAGTYTVEATKATGSCVATMTGSVTVTVISLPTAYNVTGGGSYCAGGTGVAVGLSNSETGVNYQLKKDGNNVGSAVAGTGSALPFGNQTGAGTYTVEATTATGGCTATMTGSVTVTVISLPTAYNVTGGGSYCAGGTGVAVGLSNSQTGVNYQLKKDGNNIGSAVAGTGSALPFGNQTGAGTYTVEATTATGGCTATMTGSVTVTVISLPTAYNVTGGGSYCTGGTGVAVGLSNSQTGVNYQLKKDGSNVGGAVAGTGSALPFGNQTGAGTYTVEATTATGGCTATMTGSVTVTVISLPTAYNVTGGGSYCAGGTGVAVGLSNSETGVNYQLKKDGNNVGSVVAGTGSALPFGNQTGAGTYTVEATTATGGCTATMTGSVTVTVISLPTAYNVTGGGSYCAGGTGVAVGLSNSQTGVNYQLKKDGSNVGSAVAGTGSALPFGNQTGAGTYTVEATTATGGCTATMTGSVTVTVISLPTAYSVTGGGSYCAGGTGVAVGLSNSQTGVNYQLKKDGSNVGSVVAGTGSALPFGNQTGAGTYTVEATTATGGCTATMTGSVTVTVISLPTAYNVTGGGSYCAGGTGVAVGLSNSETGVNYQLKKDGNNVGSVVAGSGSALSFGNQTDAGSYTVEATTTTGGCVATMSGSATVSINALPTAFSVTGGGSYCQGGTGVLVGLSSSVTGINYQLKLGDAVVGSSLPGTGSALSFGLQTSLGTYMVVATNAATNCTLGMTGTAQVASYPLPLATVSGTTTACKGGASSILTFTGSNGTAPYTFSYQLNGGTVQTVTTTGGSSTATVSQSSSAEGVYNYTLVSVSDANCSQTQSGSAVVRVQTKPVITLTTLQQTLNEGNSQTFCDTDANPVNGLQFAVTGSCVVGNPVWRVQVGSGAWSDWSATAPVTQSSNNQPHRYQAACDASCAVTYTNPIEVTINYRASVPQNVSLLVDGVVVNAGETKDICNVEGNAITFNASCGVGEVLVYSVDGGDYTSVVPSQMVDGQYHNYRVRCRKSDNVHSCIETESNVLRFRLTSMSMVPMASLNVTSGCGLATSFIGTSNCGSMSTIWYNAVTNEALAGLPSQTPSETTSYYVRCQAIGGCMSEKSNVVTYTVASVSEVPVVVVSADVVCTGVDVTVSTSCPAGSSALWNTGVTENSFKVSFANVTKQSYSVRCVYANGCQSSVSASKEVMWKAFELTLINIGESKSGIKTNSRSAWANQFVTPDAGPSLDQSTQANPTVYFSENLNKTAPRYWTIHVDACSLGESGSLTYDLLATPETGIVRSYNTHENSAPYFMFANRSGWTELYAQNHPLYGFYADNGSGGNVYDEGFPKGLYKLGIRYWDMKGWGSIYPSTRKPQGNVLAYQEYWFRIQSKDGIGVGAARTAESGEQVARGEGQVVSDNGQLITDNSAFATVLPNPVTNVLRLKVQESKGQVVQTTLTDASGRAILHRQFVPETNTHQEEFGVSELPKGMYFLQVMTSEKRATLKVIKL